MAAPTRCDVCEEQEVDFILSDLQAADTKYFCAGCFVRTTLGLAVALLPAEEVLAAVGPIHVAQRDAKEGKQANTQSRKRKPAEEAEQVPEAEPAQGLEEAPAATADG